MSASLSSLDTPVALLDVPRMQRNIRRMQQRMNELGVRLRPHVKTSKSLPVIQAQIAAGATGVTVSTLKEAEHCFAEGIEDVFYAVAIAPGKLDQAFRLRRNGCRLSILTDSVVAAQAIVAFGQQHGSKSIAMATARGWLWKTARSSTWRKPSSTVACNCAA